MITLINRLLGTPQRRTCLLFCLGLTGIAAASFADVRLGYVLGSLGSMEGVFKLTSHPWVSASMLGRFILNLLSTPMQALDVLRSLILSLSWPQWLWFIVLILFVSENKASGRTRSCRRWLLSLTVMEILILAGAGFLVSVSYFSPTTGKAVAAFQQCGYLLMGGSLILLVFALVLIPISLIRDFPGLPEPKSDGDLQ